MTNIDDIARKLAAKNNITIKDANKFVRDTFDIIGSELTPTTGVYIKDFGKFQVKARNVRKPGTTDTFVANVLSFKSFDALKAKVN